MRHRFFLLTTTFAFFATHLAADEPSFTKHVSPLLYKLGCSAGTCHGAFSGKAGFRLSLFAGNPELDYQNLRGGLGRRIDTLASERSLLLMKPSGAMEHGGGLRFPKGGWEYQLLKAWIDAGARFDPARETKIVGVRVEPKSLVLAQNAKPQPLKVFAKFATGQEEDVTKFARFESLDPGIAAVSIQGTITPVGTGDVAILGHYAGEIGFCTVLVPGPPIAGLKVPDDKPGDRVDQQLLERMKQLNIVPSPRCDDLDFLRRVYLDVIGQLPTPAEARAFLADPAPDKRAKVIDRLLEHPYFPALWAGKLCDMVGADDRFLADGVHNFHDWFRNKLEKNTPWDQIAYGVLVATAADDRTPEQIMDDQKRDAEDRKKQKESEAKKEPPPKDDAKPWHKGYATRKTLDLFYNNLIHQQALPGKPRMIDARKIALRSAHTFLGVRLECAQCHKHPHDRWSQQDFFSFATVFAHVDFGVDPELKAKKVNLAGTHPTLKPVEEMLDPDTQLPLPPRRPDGALIEVKPGVDPRKELWSWLVQENNPFFARALVNRLWAHYLGRGFVEPADAQAGANPPSHPEVMDELARDFVQSKYDLKRLHRRILNTLAYQRDWRTNPSNSKDERNFSHRLLRRLSAEQALDAIAQVTGTTVKFPKRYATPREGVKAVELSLSRVGGDDGYVLQIFGRPIRVQSCDCERSPAASLSQTMYLFNDEELIAKIHDPKGRLQDLVAREKDDAKLMEELYLWTLTRIPNKAEVERSLQHVRSAASRLEGYQDVMWSLLNRQDFVVNR